MGYHLEGDLQEDCDCRVLCPCWIGEDPDNGTCDTILAYNMRRGTINETDVAGLSLALMAHIPETFSKETGASQSSSMSEPPGSRKRRCSAYGRVNSAAPWRTWRNSSARWCSRARAHHLHIERGPGHSKNRFRRRLCDGSV
jgi:Protein of unknown function (DUF1326)